MKRRKFINQLGVGVVASVMPSTLLSFTPATRGLSKKITFGIVTDVHKDLMPDADQRLEAFVNKATKKNVDFIIQMGDFCFGDNKNKDFMKVWEAFNGPKYHILGNHDMDKNSKEEVMEFWGMHKNYYSFDLGGYHFVVLDANFLYQDGKFIDYKHANFYVNSNLRAYINDQQIEWFKSDLESTQLPTIVFSHQSLWHDVGNRQVLQHIMEKNKQKVICALNGHDHTDFHFHKNSIDYIGINSMSYKWVSGKFESTERFPKELYKEYGNLHHIAGYQDPLYAFVTLKPNGIMKVDGVKSNWMSPSPYDMGMVSDNQDVPFSAEISDYKIKFKTDRI
ncbi:metallophosphoesterase family protein [Snuella lapsa]|uniref:Calcineurin-like phosphoesterase domain-containing protein n=1 Tax=Snuella lapsa TaxID=870481 RepID=A0ABP6YG86_9FLAO